MTDNHKIINTSFKFYRPINTFNTHCFIDLIKNCNWFDVYSLQDIDDKVNCFLTILLSVIDFVFPLTILRPKKKSTNKWFTYDLEKLKQKCFREKPIVSYSWASNVL